MLGRVLRDYRVRTGLKVAQLAALAEIRRETLSRIEAGRSRVAADTLIKLTDLITVPPTEWVRPWVEEESRLRALLFITRHLIDRGELDSVRLIFERVRTLTRLSPNHLRGEVYHQWAAHYPQSFDRGQKELEEGVGEHAWVNCRVVRQGEGHPVWRDSVRAACGHSGEAHADAAAGR